MQMRQLVNLDIRQKGNDYALILYKDVCSVQNRTRDMIDLLHRPLTEVSAILDFGGHLENRRMSRGQESFFNVCHVKNIW